MFRGYQNNVLDLRGRDLGLFMFLLLLDLVLRGYALWKSAQKGQKVWFIALLIINSVGILPAIYLLIDHFSKKKSR